MAEAREYCTEHDQPLDWCAHYVLTRPACECGHGRYVHDIRRDGTRSRCFFLAGPRGVQCACLNFTETDDT